MAFRTQKSLAAQYENLKSVARGLKATCDVFVSSAAVGNVEITLIVDSLLPTLTSAIATFTNVPGGMAEWARAQENDVDYDVAAEFVAMRAAAVTARDWIVTNLPKVDGYITEHTIAVDGTKTPRTVTPTQTAGLRTALQAVSAAIEV